MSDTPDIPDDDALAAEYVLRLLDDATQREVERRLVTDAAFSARVRAWEADFSGLAADIPEASPPTSAKARVMAAIAPKASPKRRGFGHFAALAVAVIVAAVVLTPVLRAPAPVVPEYQAALVSESGDLVITAGFTPDENLLIITRSEGAARPGRAIELWLIPEGASVPVSLGVLPETSEARLIVSAEVAGDLPGGTLAVSDEPLGGSTTGAPTGDVLAAAPVSAL